MHRLARQRAALFAVGLPFPGLANLASFHPGLANLASLTRDREEAPHGRWE
jgi:hypothetical protein